MQLNLPSTHLGHTPETTPAAMVYKEKCATAQAQRHGVGGVLAHTQAYSIHMLGQQNWRCECSQF